MAPEITFCIPCLNEAENIAATLDALRTAVARAGHSYEALVVDDGSTDDTAGVVERYKSSHPDAPVRLHRNPGNLGLGSSLRVGAELGRGRYYRFLSGDAVEQLEATVRILSQLGNADVIVPYHDPRVRGPFRMFISLLFTSVVNLLSGNRLPYYNGGNVHLREDVLRYMPRAMGFGFQAELLTRVLARGATFVPVFVDVDLRSRGSSKAFSPKNVVSVAASLFRIASERFRRSRTPRRVAPVHSSGRATRR